MTEDKNKNKPNKQNDDLKLTREEEELLKSSLATSTITFSLVYRLKVSTAT